jgi:hypothetical protein
MRIAVTLTRKGNVWEAAALPNTPCDEQLKAFKAAKAEGITCDEMVVISSSGTLKRAFRKEGTGVVPAPAPEAQPEPVTASAPENQPEPKSPKTKK